MVGKCKSLVMFVAIVGISCMVLNFSGIDAQVYAQDASTVKSKECPLDKGGKCSSNKGCSKKPKCDKGGGHRINEMMNLTRCAKKELLKEKIKANLEKKIGTKLDQIADLLVDAMLDEYRSAIQGKARNSTLENNIREVFSRKGPQ
jgi:hypothetical protein